MPRFRKILFMRKASSSVARGRKVWNHYPMSMVCSLESFILVKFDMDTIDLTKIKDHNTITLKLDKLMKQYPPTPREVIHEDGSLETVIDAGYFDEDGVSSHSGLKEITIDDITWEGRDE